MELAEKIYDFAYDFDYWDFMAYCDEMYGEYCDKEEPLGGIREELIRDPEGMAEYVDQYDVPEAETLAAEIRGLVPLTEEKRSEIVWESVRKGIA